MYEDLGKAMENHPSWSVYILNSNEDFENLYGRKVTKKRKLFNGFVKMDYYQYFDRKPR